MQKTFIDRFNINLPRTTKDQAGYGKLVRKEDIQTGDLIFFKTGRGPNGYHVGIYVKEDKFLHASTKGGVIYSSMNSPYWKKAFGKLDEYSEKKKVRLILTALFFYGFVVGRMPNV